jgi:hypothetical protein
MQITPPYGFQEIVVLAKTHRVLLPQERTLPSVFLRMNPMPVSFTEFAVAGRDYPLVFVSTDEGKTFGAMLVLGFEAHQNLFIEPDQTWDPTAYVPAYVRRYPFCMTRVTVDGKEAPERVACVAKSALSDEGTSLFDEQGNALAEWEQRQKLLFEYEADLNRTEEMCKLLARHRLLEPFAVQANPNAGDPLQLTGMYRVNEAKLKELSANIVKSLVQDGVLSRIYAHLHSLDNFGRMLDRRARVVAESAIQVPDKNKLN